MPRSPTTLCTRASSSPPSMSNRSRSDAGSSPASSSSVWPGTSRWIEKRQQLAVVIHLLDAEHLRRRHANTTRLRHDVLLVGEPRHRLARDPDDDGRVVRQLDAVRFVHPATGEANDPLDLAAADPPYH